MIYLDGAATTRVRREVLEAMWPYLTGEFGNASSVHGVGRGAALALDGARASVAECLGCRKSEVIFTGGGTEADNLAVKGIALARPGGRHIVTTAVEHEAVLGSCEYLERVHGFAVTYVGVDGFGRVAVEDVARALRPDTTLVSVMLANNEVGTMQDLAGIVGVAGGVPVHTDGVQGVGGSDLDVGRLGVDALSLSGHKVGAPKGVGVLYLRGRIPVEAVLHGGGQERGRRSGTENVAGAVGFAVGLRMALEGWEARAERVRAVRDGIIRGVLEVVPGAVLTGHPVERLPGSASFCFPGVSGEGVLLGLEERGIVCSSGSACAAGRDEPSHTLLAMGIAPEVARTAVRFTFGDEVGEAEVPAILGALREAVEALRGGGGHG